MSLDIRFFGFGLPAVRLYLFWRFRTVDMCFSFSSQVFTNSGSVFQNLERDEMASWTPFVWNKNLFHSFAFLFRSEKTHYVQWDYKLTFGNITLSFHALSHTHTHSHTRAYIHTHTHIHAHTCTHTHTHPTTCACAQMSQTHAHHSCRIQCGW